MTEQPPRSTLEKVRHHYSRFGPPSSNTATGLAIVAIQSIFDESSASLLKYVPAGVELEQGLLRQREAFQWMVTAVTMNPSDNSSADGKLVENE